MTLKDLCANREVWSFSSLNQFVNLCSLQWAFQRYYRVQPEFTPVSLSFGSAFHRTLEWINLQRVDGKQAQPKEVSDLFGDVWSRQQQEDRTIRFSEKQDANGLTKQGQDLATCYLGSIDPAEEVVSVSQSFAVPLVDMYGAVLDKPIVGETDLVVKKDGRKVIVDWKTSATRWAAGKPHRALQPTVYLYGISSAMPNGSLPEFRFDIVVKNQTPVFEQHTTKRNRDQMLRMVELTKVADEVIRHETFLPNNESMFCKSCPFQTACKAWHRNRTKLISVAKAA